MAARFSRYWYMKRVSEGSFHKLNIQLHRQHGPIVRIAPNQFSIDDPEATKVIYGLAKGFVKSEWYKASGDPFAPHTDLFTDLNPTRHASNRRLVANLYSATSLRNMEGDVDECIDMLVTRLDQLAKSRQAFDLQFWMQSYAFDVIGQITLGKRFGILDEGADKDDIFGNLHEYLKYCAVIGVYNELHRFLFWLMTKFPTKSLTRIGTFTVEQIELSRSRRKNDPDSKTRMDFLSRTMGLHEDNPAKFPLAAVQSTCLVNIGAGSDTTSISLCSILYNLMTHPDVLQKLRDEIDQKLEELGDATRIPFKDTQAMPYLQACIKEALRLHPATGLPLARVVPQGGATISGTYFPEGTVVGINTWVAHRNPQVFGEDVEAFRPERWLDSDKQRLSTMESCWMPFGAGSRTCIGKNISLLEMNKLVPVLVREFDFVAYDPSKVTHEDYWLVKQRNMMCKVSRRGPREMDIVTMVNNTSTQTPHS
ncbi:hypothetical protein NCS57_00791000 [Fusarium keratoplasticum]|uniref:Uncharacterized protein n=1 Tax=Fusarium keratoplasticum TaxID=1328300 RepID=A0ACC0QYA8_9HYPO|nr:hypothetical protein NCS57_00791000 [Fusarium keratoplasticum]KAI8669749.1 hypothetical protein NCS57_00791000 [Fusarium keratoplasticum]KAI8674333.1 hypothetical protein NCS55_00757000 [Fusarium keratoplasticum]